MPTQIVFVVLPAVHLLDLAGPDQVFLEAKDHGADISIRYCALSHDITSSGSFPIGNLELFNQVELKAEDYLIIPGVSVEYLLSSKFAAEHDYFDWMKRQYAKGAILCSICTGAFALGQAGLLNGRACTTHWKRTEDLKRKFPAIKLVEDVLFTEDERILTSAGVTAGIDLALNIVARIKNESVAYSVARELVIYIRRNGQESQHSLFMQYRNHLNSGIHRVQDYLQDHLDKGPTLPALSEVACMSTRNLTRTFKRETGITINMYLNLVRKERLRALMNSTDYTRKQLARYCGLKSERQVIRLLKQIA